MEGVLAYMLTYGLPALYLLLAVPLILKKVQPNAMYGFVAKKAQASDWVWYKANTFFGWAIVVAALVGGGIDAYLLHTAPPMQLAVLEDLLGAPPFLALVLAGGVTGIYVWRL